MLLALSTQTAAQSISFSLIKSQPGTYFSSNAMLLRQHTVMQNSRNHDAIVRCFIKDHMASRLESSGPMRFLSSRPTKSGLGRKQFKVAFQLRQITLRLRLTKLLLGPASDRREVSPRPLREFLLSH
jgi:hypothetical protein